MKCGLGAVQLGQHILIFLVRVGIVTERTNGDNTVTYKLNIPTVVSNVAISRSVLRTDPDFNLTLDELAIKINTSCGPLQMITTIFSKIFGDTSYGDILQKDACDLKFMSELSKLECGELMSGAYNEIAKAEDEFLPVFYLSKNKCPSTDAVFGQAVVKMTGHNHWSQFLLAVREKNLTRYMPKIKEVMEDSSGSKLYCGQLTAHCRSDACADNFLCSGDNCQARLECV